MQECGPLPPRAAMLPTVGAATTRTQFLLVLPIGLSAAYTLTFGGQRDSRIARVGSLGRALPFAARCALHLSDTGCCIFRCV